mgnify:CR=1 FL=1
MSVALIVIIVIFIILIIVGIIIFFYWRKKHKTSAPSPLAPSPASPTGSPPNQISYNTSQWQQYLENAQVSGFTSTTPYDSSATSGTACSQAIQTAVKQAGDTTVVGWAWNSGSNAPPSCRAITTSNLTNPCYTLPGPNSNAVVSLSAINYYDMNECSSQAPPG